jgi:streptogramin lyase
MAGPNGIAAGPDGNLWFTEYQGNNIGKITPATGVITEYAIPGSNYGNITNGITAGSDGNMWFALGLEYKIGKISPETGTITKYPIHN